MGVWLDKHASILTHMQPEWCPINLSLPLVEHSVSAGLAPGSLKGTYQLRSYFGQQTEAVEGRWENVLKTWPAIFRPLKTLSQHSGSQLGQV